MTTEADARAEWLRHITSWPFVNARPKRLGVAVSGGSDSMALLDLMLWQAKDLGFEVRAVTVDHGIRPEAKDEAAQVAALCAERGVAHDTLTWGGWDGTGNLQAKARRARYALINEWAKAHDVDWVALGHTVDDQAETVLMRIARRAGVDGLAGMPSEFERDGVKMIRPLLRTEREVLRDYLRDQGIPWSDDPSNEDDSFERVRARNALKTLREIGIEAESFAAVADNARAAKWALDHYALSAVEEGRVEIDRGDVMIPDRLSPKNPTPQEITRRLKNAAVQWISGSDYPPRAMAFINADVALLEAKTHTLGGCVVTRIDGAHACDVKFRFTREYNAVRDTVSPTDALWDGRWRLEGPHAPDLEVRALGETVKDTPWRETGMPRQSLLASPAIWRDNDLIAAPVAGYGNGWTAEATGRGTFAEFLLSR